MKNLRKYILLVPRVTICLTIFFVVGTFTFAIGSTYITNNLILNNYKNEFQQIIHPPGSSRVAFHSGVHGSPGNGKACFYFVGEVRRFAGEKSDIRAFYPSKLVELEFLENGQFSESVPYGLNRLSRWYIPSTETSDRLYLVYSLNTNYDDYGKNLCI
jgi:hypothetical protein